MTKIGLGLPCISIADVRESAETVAQYDFASFSVYGDLGDLPPYAALHAAAGRLQQSNINAIGPMGIPVGLQHPEVIAQHALALEEQLPGQSYVGLVRGAFLSQIGEQPASLARLRETTLALQRHFQERGLQARIIFGGFGAKLLQLAGELSIEGIKLGGSANADLADHTRHTLDTQQTQIVMGSVSVIDADRQAARRVARKEVSKYLNVVGSLDPTLTEDERNSLSRFIEQYKLDPHAAPALISDGLLNKFAIAGTPDDALSQLSTLTGSVDRFELGTPHGLGARATSIEYIAQTVLNELGDSYEV